MAATKPPLTRFTVAAPFVALAAPVPVAEAVPEAEPEGTLAIVEDDAVIPVSVAAAFLVAVPVPVPVAVGAAAEEAALSALAALQYDVTVCCAPNRRSSSGQLL